MHLMQQEGEEMSNEVDVDKELWASKGGSQRSLKGKDYFLINSCCILKWNHKSVV